MNRHNSTIKIKVEDCASCGDIKPIYAKGMCQGCYKKSKFKKWQSNQKKVKAQKMSGSYFEHYYKPIIDSLGNKLVCQESGEQMKIGAFNRYSTEVISWIAHILPKSQFPTVAVDNNNVIILGGFYSESQMHNYFDSSWSRVASMDVCPLAVRYIESVFESLTPEEQRRARGILEIIKK